MYTQEKPLLSTIFAPNRAPLLQAPVLVAPVHAIALAPLLAPAPLFDGVPQSVPTPLL